MEAPPPHSPTRESGNRSAARRRCLTGLETSPATSPSSFNAAVGCWRLWLSAITTGPRCARILLPPSRHRDLEGWGVDARSPSPWGASTAVGHDVEKTGCVARPSRGEVRTLFATLGY